MNPMTFKTEPYHDKYQESLDKTYDEINKLKNVAPRQNVYDAIGKLPQLVPLKESIKKEGKNLSHTLKGNLNIPQHDPRYHNDRDVKIFKNWLAEDMNSKRLDEKIAFYNNLMGKNSKHAKYRNLEWDKPSPTVVAHLYKDGLMFIHPDEKQARTITVREAGLLQSFPIDFNFIGSVGYCYKMIGNAVPPILAKNIAEGICKVINIK
jgi:DNA (cytosine-5)-methyltransferase 1